MQTRLYDAAGAVEGRPLVLAAFGVDAQDDARDTAAGDVEPAGIDAGNQGQAVGGFGADDGVAPPQVLAAPLALQQFDDDED